MALNMDRMPPVSGSGGVHPRAGYGRKRSEYESERADIRRIHRGLRQRNSFGPRHNGWGERYIERILLQPEFPIVPGKPLLQSIANKLDVVVDFPKQRSDSQHIAFQREQLPRFHQLLQNVRQFGNVRSSRTAELYNAWEFRWVRCRLGSKCAQLPALFFQLRARQK